MGININSCIDVLRESIVQIVEMGQLITLNKPLSSAGYERNPIVMRDNAAKRRAWSQEINAAVKKVLTWKNDFGGKPSFVSQHSVIRIETEKSIRDYVLQIYDIDPDSENKKGKICLSIYLRSNPEGSTQTIGHYNSLRSARKVAHEWLVKTAKLFGATGMQRITMRAKPTSRDIMKAYPFMKR